MFQSLVVPQSSVNTSPKEHNCPLPPHPPILDRWSEDCDLISNIWLFVLRTKGHQDLFSLIESGRIMFSPLSLWVFVVLEG